MKNMLFAWRWAPRFHRGRGADGAGDGQPMAGTRLDVSATGEVTRVPDVAIISAGVVTRRPPRAPRSRRMRRAWSGCWRR